MKRKRKIMWKAWLIFIIFFISFFTVPIAYTKLFVENKVNAASIIVDDEQKLRTIGYSLNDIAYLINKKELLKYALSNSYDSKLMDYAEIENFDIKKLNNILLRMRVFCRPHCK